jgi:hypothetical protein
MKISSLKIPAVVAVVLGAVTSANAAMPMQRANATRESFQACVPCSCQERSVGVDSVSARLWVGRWPLTRTGPHRIAANGLAQAPATSCPSDSRCRA